MFAVHSCFHQIPDAAFAAVIDITAVWICLAGGTALPYNFCWRLFEARLIGKLFIQRIEISRELEYSGLIVRRKQGLGKPALITLNYPADAKLIAKEGEDVQA